MNKYLRIGEHKQENISNLLHANFWWHFFCIFSNIAKQTSTYVHYFVLSSQTREGNVYYFRNVKLDFKNCFKNDRFIGLLFKLFQLSI